MGPANPSRRGGGSGRIIENENSALTFSKQKVMMQSDSKQVKDYQTSTCTL